MLQNDILSASARKPEHGHGGVCGQIGANDLFTFLVGLEKCSEPAVLLTNVVQELTRLLQEEAVDGRELLL